MSLIPGAAASAPRRNFRVRRAVVPPPRARTSYGGRPRGASASLMTVDTLGDGPRRHARPSRRWISPVLGRCRVAGPSLRKDALRPGAARSCLPRGSAGDRRFVYAGVAEDTLEYVLRDMTGPHGGVFRRRMPTVFRQSRQVRIRRTKAKVRSTSGAMPKSRRSSARTQPSSSASGGSSPTAMLRTIRRGSSPAGICVHGEDDRRGGDPK